MIVDESWIVFTIRVLVENTSVEHGPPLPSSADVNAQLVQKYLFNTKNEINTNSWILYVFTFTFVPSIIFQIGI